MSGKTLLSVLGLVAGLILTSGCQNSDSKNTSDGGGGKKPGKPGVSDPFEGIDPLEDFRNGRQCLEDKGQTAGPMNNLPSIIGGKRLTKEGPLGRSTVYIQVAGPTQRDGSTPMMTCSATLIGLNMVITAAHCFPDTPGQPLRGRVVFSTDPNDQACGPRELRRMEAVAIHPNWRQRADEGNDIALIRIEGTAPADYQPLPVLNTFPKGLSEQDSYLAGYGRNIDDVEGHIKGPVSPLKIAVVQAYPDPRSLSADQRSRVPGSNYNNPNTHVLAFDTSKGQAMCPGDSGGPATIKHNGMVKLIGVASFVLWTGKVPTCKMTAVYNSVSYYQTWLKGAYDSLSTALSTPNPFELDALNETAGL